MNRSGHNELNELADHHQLVNSLLVKDTVHHTVCDHAPPCPLSLQVSRQRTLQPVTMPPLPAPLTSHSARKSARLRVEVTSATGAPYSATVASSSQ